MIPLQLSSKEQSVLAEICSLCRSIAWDLANNDEENARISSENLLDHVIRSGFTPQQFDSLYDRLHRSGSNS